MKKILLLLLLFPTLIFCQFNSSQKDLVKTTFKRSFDETILTKYLLSKNNPRTIISNTCGRSIFVCRSITSTSPIIVPKFDYWRRRPRRVVWLGLDNGDLRRRRILSSSVCCFVTVALSEGVRAAMVHYHRSWVHKSASGHFPGRSKIIMLKFITV